VIFCFFSLVSQTGQFPGKGQVELDGDEMIDKKLA